MTELSALLASVIGGDATGIGALRRVPQSDIRAAARQVDQLHVSRAALLRLLQAWNSGTVTTEQVRWWAIFVFLGGFPQDWSPSGWVASYTAQTQPLEIDYADDDLVNEIVFRLKDLGDAVDGTISDKEREAMISDLAKGSA